MRQGGILSPFLFRFYIRSLIQACRSSEVGCFIIDRYVNLLAYADDIVLLAPSWCGMQHLLKVIECSAHDLGMFFNTAKTVCMTFNPKMSSKIVTSTFPSFVLNGSKLAFVQSFKYLGHHIDVDLADDTDINREIRNLFARTNILLSRFRRCSVGVKLMLFKSFCLCFYGIELWSDFKAASMNRLKACYTKCAKSFFGYSKYSSVTEMLLYLGLPSFNTIVHNASVRLQKTLIACGNAIISSIAGVK